MQKTPCFNIPPEADFYQLRKKKFFQKKDYGNIPGKTVEPATYI
jgi:hypothetical protein